MVGIDVEALDTQFAPTLLYKLGGKIMLIITKTNDAYGYYTIDNYTVAQWRERIPEVPPEIVAVIDDDHPLRETFDGIGRFIPTVKNGELTDVTELPPEQTIQTAEEKTAILEGNLEKTAPDVLRLIEPVLPRLYELLGEPMPRELSRVLDERAEVRTEIFSL